LKALYGFFKTIKIEINLALAQDDLGNKILRRQISDKSMVLLPFRIHDDDGRSPLNGIALHQSLVLVEVNLKGNEVILYGETDIGVGIGNSCQLLAPQSEIVIEVHQD